MEANISDKKDFKELRTKVEKNSENGTEQSSDGTNFANDIQEIDSIHFLAKVDKNLMQDKSENSKELKNTNDVNNERSPHGSDKISDINENRIKSTLKPNVDIPKNPFALDFRGRLKWPFKCDKCDYR